MSTLVNDPYIEKHLLEERRAKGLDIWDEVWEGTYVIMTSPNDEHQDILAGLIEVLRPIVRKLGLGVLRPPVNISDRVDDWKYNYRIPDASFFAVDNCAENHGAFWFGGPDLAIEILSPDDRAREKFDFYESVGTKELVFINRNPWQLEVHRRGSEGFEMVDVCRVEDSGGLSLETLPITIGLVGGEPRPRIHIVQEQLQVSDTI